MIGGFYTSVLGTFATIYAYMYGKKCLQVAYEQYSVRNYQDYSDRTSDYKEKNEQIHRIEQIAEVSCEDHTITELSFEVEEVKVEDKDTPAGKEKKIAELVEDFKKNIQYYGSMDHFIQLEYENSVMRKTLLKLQ